MHALAECWPVSAITPREALSASFQYLREDLFKPAGSDVRATATKESLVLASISAIGKLAFRTTARGDMPALARLIAKNWFHVYKWIPPFTEALIRAVPHTNVRRAAVVIDFTRLFRVFTSDEGLLRLLVKEDTSLEIATQLWLYSSAADKIFSMDPAIGHGSRMFYNYAVQSTPEHLLTVVPHCGGTEAFTQRVLGSLALILDGAGRTVHESDFWDVISYNLFIIGHITTHEPFLRAFLSSNASPLVLSILAKTVKVIESLRESGDVTSAPNSALGNALAFLHNTFLQPDGY